MPAKSDCSRGPTYRGVPIYADEFGPHIYVDAQGRPFDPADERAAFNARADRARDPRPALALAGVLVCFVLGTALGVIDAVVGRVRYHLWQTRGGMSDAGTRR